MSRLMRYLVAMGSFFVLIGCSDPAPTPDAAARKAAQTVEKPGEGVVVREPVALDEIRWTEVQGHREIGADRLSEQAQQVVKESPIPVLLPDDDGLLGSAYLTIGESWYTASMKGAGVTVVVNGSGKSREIAGVTTDKEGDGPTKGDHILTRTHGIVTLSFQEFGAAYSIDVECEAPMEDSRCTGDDFVINLAEEAGVVRRER